MTFLLVFQLYNKVYQKRNIVLIVIGGYIYIALALSPPLFGFGQFTYNVKFQCCYIAAYDLHSYIHGCFLIALIMGPVVVVIIFCYLKIIRKVRMALECCVLVTFYLNIYSGMNTKC